MGKGSGRAEVVDPQQPVFVGGDQPVAHLDPFHTVVRDVHDQLGAVQVVPGALHRQVGKEVLAALDHQGHVADHAVPVAGHGEKSGCIGGVGQ